MKTRYLEGTRLSIFLFISLMIPYVFAAMTKNCFSSAMVFIVNEGLMSAFQTGTITAVFYIVYASLQVVGGYLTDKWHPEYFVTIALVGGGICNILIFFFNTNYIALLAIWSVNAIFQAPLWPAAFKIISTMTAPAVREQGLVIATLGYPTGTLLCYGVAALVDRWQSLFLISGIGLFLFTVYWLCAFGKIKKSLIEEETVHIDYGSAAKREHSAFLPLVISSGLIFMLIVTFIRSMFDSGIKALTPTMINACYDSVSPTFATTLNMIILIAGIFGPFVAQAIYPRFIRNEVAACALFLTAAVPCVITVAFVGRISYIFIVIALALLALLMSASGLFTTSLIASRFNKWGYGATVAGLLNCMASFAIVAANMVFTGMAESLGWNATTAVWVVMIILGTLLGIVTIPIWKKFSVKARNL